MSYLLPAASFSPGPDVSIGEGCVIGNGVRLSSCVVMKGVKVKDHSKVG